MSGTSRFIMSGTSRREADRASRLARPAALSGTSGKVCPAGRATQLLEAIIEPGDRVTIEGDNQKQADFLASALAAANTEDTPMIVEAAAFSGGVVARVNEIAEHPPRVDVPGDWVDVAVQSAAHDAIEPLSDKPIGANTMRPCLALCLLLTLCASASAATVNHSRTHHHVTVSHSQGVTSGFAAPSWAYATPWPPVGGGGFGRGGHMGGFGGGAHVGGIDVGHIGQFGGGVDIDSVSVGHVGEIGGGVRVGGLAVGGMGRFGASYIGDHGVHDQAMLRSGRQWSGYTVYGYNPDCNDFLFRHPDYQWQPSCS